MKILIWVLVIIILFSACSSSPHQSTEPTVFPSTSPSAVLTPEISPSASPGSSQPASPSPQPADQDLAALITQKVQDYIQTKTFEGFTNTNTYQDVYESYSKKGMTPYEANVIYSVDLVGFPANMHCHFAPILDDLTFYIVYEPGLKDYETKFNEFLTNISDVLGGNYIKRDLGGNDGNGYEYVWQSDTYSIGVGTKEDVYKSTGQLASINFSGVDNNPPKNIPDIFHYQYGTDFNTINTHEMASMTKEYVSFAASLNYNMDNVITEYNFSINTALKAVTFDKGSYEFSNNTPLSQGDSVDIMEETSNNLQEILGKPEIKSYDVSEDISYYTATEMKKHEYDEFGLSVDWDKLWLSMYYDKDNGISASLYF